MREALLASQIRRPNKCGLILEAMEGGGLRCEKCGDEWEVPRVVLKKRNCTHANTTTEIEPHGDGYVQCVDCGKCM